MVIGLILLIIALIVACIVAVSYRRSYNAEAEENANNKIRVEHLTKENVYSKRLIDQLQELVKEYEAKIVVLTDDVPTEDTPYNRGLKLSNEIVPYITKNGDKIQILVYNNKGVVFNDNPSVNEPVVPEPEKPEPEKPGDDEHEGKEPGTVIHDKPELPKTDEEDA